MNRSGTDQEVSAMDGTWNCVPAMEDGSLFRMPALRDGIGA